MPHIRKNDLTSFFTYNFSFYENLNLYSAFGVFYILVYYEYTIKYPKISLSIMSYFFNGKPTFLIDRFMFQKRYLYYYVCDFFFIPLEYKHSE